MNAFYVKLFWLDVEHFFKTLTETVGLFFMTKMEVTVKNIFILNHLVLFEMYCISLHS